MMDIEEETNDDTTTSLQLQQFMDEWNYRILNSSLANDWDREDCVLTALELFEMQGMTLTEEDKKRLSEMEDEDLMIQEMAKLMPMGARKTFGNFALQLKLVCSTTARVRHILETGSHAEVAKAMEDGDTGITQQILKHAIVEAGQEVKEKSGTRESWAKSTGPRLLRLSKCAAEADYARKQLTALEAQIAGFASEQSQKSKKVLMSFTAGNNHTLKGSCFATWLGWMLQRKGDAAFHNKFKEQIRNAEDALILFKKKQLANVRGVLIRKATQTDSWLQQEVLRLWSLAAKEEKEEREMAGDLQAAKDKISQAKATTVGNTKRVLTRMTASNDASLQTLCIQSWRAEVEESRKDRVFNEDVQAQKERFEDFKKNKNGQSQNVLGRMLNTTNTGLIYSVWSAWVEDYKLEKSANEMQKLVNGSDDRFKHLNQKQKNAATNMASKANHQEEENILATIFYNWQSEAKISVLIRHYGGKMDAKKHQLDAVQTMFKSFASQLEQGIGNTPRTQRKSQRDREKARGLEGPTA